MARFLVGAAACAAVAATLPLKTLTDPNSAPAFVDRPARARRLAPQQQLQPRPSGLGEFSDTSTLAMRFADKSAQTFRHSTALFGPLPYGGGTSGPLYYPRKPGGINATGCTGSDTWDPRDPNIPNSIVLLDRGDCHFTEKVLNMQTLGALAVVLVDNLGICASAEYPVSSALCTPSDCAGCPYFEADETGYCQCYLRYLADDGSGNSIIIPAFMVTKEDGASIIAAGATARGSIWASMKWDMPASDGSIKYELWSHSNDENAYDFRQAWEPYLPYLGTQARFTPKMFIWDGLAIGCGKSPTINRTYDCTTQCINNGWYCSADPDGDLFSGISGADVTLENLRQLCVWQEAAKSFASDYGVRWWQYADLFAANCNTAATWNQACAEAQMGRLGIDTGAVRACLADSNSTANPAANFWINKLLQQQIDDRSEMMIVSLPTVVVQDVPLRGAVSPRNVIASMCSSFRAESSPPVCRCIDVPPSSLPSCINPGGGPGGGGGSGGMPGWAVGLVVFVVFAAIAGAAGAWYFMTRTKREVEVVIHDFQRSLLTGGSGHEAEDGAGGVGVDGAIAPGDVPKVVGPGAAVGGGRGLGARLTQLRNSVLTPPPTSVELPPR